MNFTYEELIPNEDYVLVKEYGRLQPEGKISYAAVETYGGDVLIVPDDEVIHVGDTMLVDTLMAIAYAKGGRFTEDG